MISASIHILTDADLERIKFEAYERGLTRGRLEAQDTTSRVARYCGHWLGGRCESCGAQHQDFEVGGDFKCPNWVRR